MASVKTICKNTFISFVAEAEDETTPACMKSSPRGSVVRSRSAETLRSRPEAEELHEQTQQSLDRLTTVISNGFLQPAEQSPKASPSMTIAPNPASPPMVHAGSPAQKPWNKSKRVESSCSLSTMAPDDVSEQGDAPIPRMKAVWSSNSISSMVSEKDSWANMSEGDEEFEFELDIEGGAKAACEQAAAEEKKQKTITEVPKLKNKQIQKPRPANTAAPAPAQSPPVQAPPAPPARAQERPPAGVGKVTPEMSHGLVPKNQNMADMYNSVKEQPPTTLMIRNIPGKYSQNDLMMDLKDAGFGSAYDFLYLPIDKGTAANVGYAFVNFVTPAIAAKCMESFQGHRFARHQRSSNKLARIAVAHLQGLEKNLQHYENAAVNASKEKRRRPVVVANISSMFAGL